MRQFPSIDDIHAVYEDLLSGMVRYADAATWASYWEINDTLVPDDYSPIVWTAIGRLSGVDIEEAPGVPLHSDLDVRAWRDELIQHGTTTERVPAAGRGAALIAWDLQPDSIREAAEARQAIGALIDDWRSTIPKSRNESPNRRPL